MSASSYSKNTRQVTPSCCHKPTEQTDWLLWGSASLIVGFYTLAMLSGFLGLTLPYLDGISAAVRELVNTMWWGVAVGILMVAVLARIPREFVLTALGTGKGSSGIFRAALAGVLLDLCSHGILMVGAKLYEPGVSIGQVMAFLVASPWNSFSLTLVLVAMIGLPWTIAFVILSMLIAIITGLVFNILTGGGIIADNPHRHEIPENFHFWQEAVKGLRESSLTPKIAGDMLREGLKESRMVLRWIFFGLMLAALVRTFMPMESFQTWFGPTLAGLGLTVLAATIIEVCSEGSAPLAADLLTRAGAPGNSFTFLMTGVSTDYTEIMVLKETTGSWETSLFLPLVTVPQVVALGLVMNSLA